MNIPYEMFLTIQMHLTCRKDRIHNHLQEKKNEDLFRRTRDDSSKCYGEKFLWLGVPQQIALTPEINLSQYAIEIKCLTRKDQTSYLIPDD